MTHGGWVISAPRLWPCDLSNMLLGGNIFSNYFRYTRRQRCALGLSGQIVWTDICSIVSGVGCNSLYFRYINIAYQATMGAGGGRAAIPSTDNSRSYLQWHLIRKSQWVISSINSNRQQVRVGWNRIFIRVLWCTEQVFSLDRLLWWRGKKAAHENMTHKPSF